MKRLIIASLLFATPALAGETSLLSAGTNLICVGVHACSQATFQHCAVALGTDVQLPPHASHVLVTKDGVRPLHRIDARVLRMIDREIAKVAAADREISKRIGPSPKLGPEYVAEWNKACNAPAS